MPKLQDKIGGRAVARRLPMYTAPVPDEMRRVGERVRREREKAGLSLSQLAEAAGLSKAYLLKVESGTTNPSLRVLGQIADALDITVADLVGGLAVTFDVEEVEVPSSLRAFADEADLSSAEVRTLASIRWRKGDEPKTPERWRYIHDSLRVSRSIDPRNDA
jgi:transcriptional regulator with XRE-family HTH domain